MITRVDINNLVIVTRASFEPGADLTAVTGETGAGKTLLATAIGLLFGGAADAAQVGPDADHAWIEGEFEVDDSFWLNPSVAVFQELRPDDDEPLILARRVDKNGRSRAFAWGRGISKSDLAAAGALLVATAGQHIQVRLKSREYQRDTLDNAGGKAHQNLRRQMLDAWQQLQNARKEEERILALTADGLQRAEQMREDLERINLIDPDIEEEQKLLQNRDLLRHQSTLVEGLTATLQHLHGANSDGAIDQAGQAYAALSQLDTIDPALSELTEGLLSAQDSLNDTAIELRSRLNDIRENATPIDEVEERLAAYDELKRHYGGTIEAVLLYRDQLVRDLNTLDDSSEALETIQAKIEELHKKASACAEQLNASRKKLAERIEQQIAESLAELGMENSRFAIELKPDTLTSNGIDNVAFMLAPTSNHALRPVASVASGGELSRIALALLMATATKRVGTILFDEIDAGIGGRTANAVASMLRRLANDHQVICITHLPQVAARASTHVVIEKQAAKEGVVQTTLRTIRNDETAVIDELVRMLGGDQTDQAARQHAAELRGPRFLTATTENSQLVLE